MKLITEHNDILEVLTENTNGKKTTFIEGIYMQADRKNRNGRIYESKILIPAVNKYIKEQVDTGRAVGELNHPEGPSINLDKVSHKIISLKQEGKNIIGKAQILNTPMGMIAQGLLEGGVQLGVSTRGMGSVEQRNGAMYVREDFALAAVDIVQDPSAHDAFVNGIMEGAEWIQDAVSGSWRMQEHLENIKNGLKRKTINEARAMHEFQIILNTLSGNIK